ncbi:MAG: IS21 family transposase [Clostridium sp.]
MITLSEKQKIILYHVRENLSQREIHRLTGVARDTIRKYINEYEERLVELGNNLSDIQKIDLIDELTKKPKYKSSPRVKTAITDEVLEKIKAFLKENETKRMTGMSKQQMKKVDMYEALKKEGFEISYSSIIAAVNKIEVQRKEAFIRQEYVPGDVVEFDFGTVKLVIDDDIQREYQLAVFASAYSNFRWARLFPRQNTGCFLEAHAEFFKELKGNFRTVVYDNTRVVVKKFIGISDKEPTDALLKLSLYYKFRYRFCNAYSGNEKGHVERSVEVVRRKAFSKNIKFKSLKEANNHLISILKEINDKHPYGRNKSAAELLDEERINFLPDMPLYETSTITEVRVSKYSTIMIDSCQYSVPDTYVDRLLICKVYTKELLVFDGDKIIARHDKVTGFNKWKISIEHFTYTLFRKPKALVNSTAFQQMDDVLKNIYTNYFYGNEKEFILLLNCVGKYGLKAVDDAIKHLNTVCPNNISVDKIEFICTRKDDNKVIQLSDYRDDITNNSIKMLSEMNDLFK